LHNWTQKTIKLKYQVKKYDMNSYSKNFQKKFKVMHVGQRDQTPRTRRSYHLGLAEGHVDALPNIQNRPLEPITMLSVSALKDTKQFS